MSGFGGGGGLGDSSVVEGNIAVSAVTERRMAVRTITGGSVAESAITNSLIALSTVTGGRIAVGTITSDNLASSAFPIQLISSVNLMTTGVRAFSAVIPSGTLRNADSIHVFMTGNTVTGSFTLGVNAISSVFQQILSNIDEDVTIHSAIYPSPRTTANGVIMSSKVKETGAISGIAGNTVSVGTDDWISNVITVWISMVVSGATSLGSAKCYVIRRAV